MISSLAHAALGKKGSRNNIDQHFRPRYKLCGNLDCNCCSSSSVLPDDAHTCEPESCLSLHTNSECHEFRAAGWRGKGDSTPLPSSKTCLLIFHIFALDSSVTENLLPLENLRSVIKKNKTPLMYITLCIGGRHAWLLLHKIFPHACRGMSSPPSEMSGWRNQSLSVPPPFLPPPPTCITKW